MAHELTIRKTGKAEMAFVQGTKPWHGLGQELAPNAPIETWLKAAGMDWRILRSKVRYATERGQVRDFLEVPDQHVLFRSDDSKPLAVVSDRYQVVQPRDVLEFYRDLAYGNGFELTTAGTLFGGRKFWALASIGEYTQIVSSQDVMKGYLLFTTGCDGNTPTIVRDTTTCVVCDNTLRAALSAKAAHEVRITHRTKFDPDEVKDRLGIARDTFAKFARTMRELATVRFTPAAADVATLRLFDAELAIPSTSKAGNEAIDEARESRGYQAVMALFNGKGMGAQLPGRAGTAWGWVNAVTEYVDHHAAARSTDNRLNSAWFGKGDETKTRAVELALQMA